MQQQDTALGQLFIISAPSGAGKTSLINALSNALEDIVISVSHTTRAARPGEEHGVHYNFVTQVEFDRLVQQQAFLEYATVFEHSYGTTQAWVEQQLAQGFDVLLEIDWQGARQVNAKFGDNCRSIFIIPPSVELLEQRLRSRQQDSDEVIRYRMEQALAELAHFAEYDYLVCNDVFDTALAEMKAIVQAERLRLVKQQQRYSKLLS